MVCLGLEPRAAGWKAQTKPRSYGGHPVVTLLHSVISTLVRLASRHMETPKGLVPSLSLLSQWQSFIRLLLDFVKIVLTEKKNENCIRASLTNIYPGAGSVTSG